MTAAPDRRIAPPDWLTRESATKVIAALPQLRFVGGAVRNTLLGRPVKDLDAATPLTPLETMEKLEAAGIRVVPTGLAHGTVTALIGQETIEITTLRRDVMTDGRHAEVAFTADWAADAARRDFTMNALYLDGLGQLWDPVGGYEDCLAGRVRFVGDPGRRIEEDALRLLRFYRMHALYGRGALDNAGRAACRLRAQDVKSLSGERIRDETLKLLAAADPAPIVEMLQVDGVWALITPTTPNIGRLARLVPLEPNPDPLRRLAALISHGDALTLAKRLRLSSWQSDRLAALTADEPIIDLDADMRAVRRELYSLGAEIVRDRAMLQASTSARTDISVILEYATAWRRPVFPLKGADALALGLTPGRPIGELLNATRQWWIDGDFEASREACLVELSRLAKQTPS